MPELTEGRRLFETRGCRGCHKLNGVGGSIGPDLTEEGANHRSPEWLERHFLAPNAVSTRLAHAQFPLHQGAGASDLTFYMLSLTSEQMGTYYSSVRLIPSAGYGRQLFVEKELHRLPRSRRSGSEERPRSSWRHQAAFARSGSTSNS